MRRRLPERGVRRMFKRAVINMFAEVPEVGQSWMLATKGDEHEPKDRVIIREINQKYQRVHYSYTGDKELWAWNWATFNNFTQWRLYGIAEPMEA